MRRLRRCGSTPRLMEKSYLLLPPVMRRMYPFHSLPRESPGYMGRKGTGQVYGRAERLGVATRHHAWDLQLSQLGTSHRRLPVSNNTTLYVVSLDIQLVTAMGRMHTPGQGICMLIL